MQIELSADNTQIQLSDQPWQRGIQKIRIDKGVFPLLLPALSGHHFFTGVWPPPSNAIDYEPHISRGQLTQTSARSAVWQQPATRYTQVETTIHYEIVGPGTVDVHFATRSYAPAYPYGYVGLFWGTIAPTGGQRGMHLLVCDSDGDIRWRYFQAGGDNLACTANTVLGPTMAAPAHDPQHPPTYFFALSPLRFALPIQVVRWQDLSYCLEIDRTDIALTNVLQATAVGGPSWDLYWLLAPGETKTVRCRLTVAEWAGWAAVEQRYRTWSGCIAPGFVTAHANHPEPQPLALPKPVELADDSGLTLSQRLFASKGRQLLQDLNLLEICSVGCVGGGSQNAGLDDELSRDHIWGPYLTFWLPATAWAEHGARLEQALQTTNDEVDGITWRGYDGPYPRRTAAWETITFLRHLTGFTQRPQTAQEWLPYLTQFSFLGRSWTERLFDAGQGQIFHDPDKQFTQLYRHWTGYVPLDIHRALLARALFRVWNAGPEYNLLRAANAC